MEFTTPHAVRKIKQFKNYNVLIEGQKQCTLQAMSFALNFHVLDIIERSDMLIVKGIVPIGRQPLGK